MEINITLRETIKPSLPTSSECKTQKLCLFDVFQLNTYFPLILFYSKTTNLKEFSDVSTQLKKSLSEALTIFYPLAGRRCDYFSIDCNDEGAIFMEASVNTTMEVFLKPPKLESLNQLLPCEPNKCHPHQEVLPQLLVQVNKFQCGGISIGLCNLHILLDAYSCSAFLKTWFSICKGSKGEISWPDFSSAASSFPPRNTIGVRAGMLNINKDSNIEENCTTRRFLFDDKAIDELKSMSTCDETKPTRYQVVSSFISKHMIVAIKEDKKTRPMVALHVVDMRKRMGESFSRGVVGNLLWPALVVLEGVNKKTEIIDLVEILREGLGKLSKDLFLKVQNDPGFLWSDECAELMLEGIAENKPISLVFTSWANMGFNEVDFGCGKPLWVAQRGGTKQSIPNTVILMETREGIEAWITMPEKHISILEHDLDFLQFALPNPTILI
ncbi:vinorine synthase-like [Vigna unguiculata]|uniref:Shikimate O-hydroxycinnamoyltransferase n=1 Tax=Vigna unguiculata TaxID=3917 RepID=A0A4D6MXR2_VIGUN|nr:vinorine synthase-like [Vigna unguiculata]QCE06223.1 shikimate O-hydroxycinnamoyltransferase [Vigna unguiculata]